jgi:hypothetical protein
MRLLALVALALGLSAYPGALPAQQYPGGQSFGEQTRSLPQNVAQNTAQNTPQSTTQNAIAPDRGSTAQSSTQKEARAEGARLRTPSHISVLELFTSQGCSSCPAADALLKRLADREDVLALSLPVDYWDYLGWKDTLASPKFSERQRAYARARGDGAIYTPQLVVNGIAHVNGSDESQIARAIDRTAKTLPVVPVRLRREDGKLVIEAGGLSHDVASTDATIWLVSLTKSVAVPIKRGENQGTTVTYSNVVRELRPVGKWIGSPVTIEVERSTLVGTERCAVLLQQGHAGPIIGAALMKEF